MLLATNGVDSEMSGCQESGGLGRGQCKPHPSTVKRGGPQRPLPPHRYGLLHKDC
jgi:hypothetical protein